MRRLAAAARGGVSHLQQPGARQLSTSAPAASLWRQALAAAAAALGGAPAAGSGGAAAAVPPAAAAAPVAQPEAQRLPTTQDAAAQRVQGPPPAEQQQQQEQLSAWRRGADGGSARRQHTGAQPAAAGQLGLGDWSRRSSRRARRLEKQRAPEAYAAAAGQQPAAAAAAGTAAGKDAAGRDERRRGKAHKKGGSRDGPAAQPNGSKAAAAAEALGDSEVAEEEEEAAAACSTAGACPLPPARILQDDAHPIRETDISRAAWLVLSRLRAAGHEVYVVGGTVRDLLLGGTPKDFDILSSAEPHQIKRLFSRCVIVGRAFPVCQVFTEGTMIEVSSFSTQADTRLIPLDASVHMIGRQKSKDAKWSREGATWADARASNASRRDFTVNGLLYEPFSRLLFDSVGGVEDCQARRLRTICPPAESFAADPARILRGVRLAARANLELDPATAQAMEDNAAAIGQLAQGRLQMELTSLLGYGASERSLLLMWRLGLLDMLLPQHALYLRRHKVPRAPRSRSRSRRPELLFALAAELDKHVHPQRPVDPCVWVALLAAPLVVERISERWRQAYGGKARPTDASEEAGHEGIAAADSSAGHGEGDEQGGSLGEGMSSSLAGEEGGASDGSSSDGNSSSAVREGSGSHGSGGKSGALVEEQQQRQALHASKEEAWRREFVDPYQQIVSEVLDSMLLPLDSGMMAQLGRQAKKHAQQLQQVGGGKRRRRGAAAADSAAASSGAPERPLLPSALTRTALERAASLLHMEAELRGRPELQALLERGGWPGKVAPAFRHSGEVGGSGSGGGGMQLEAEPMQQGGPEPEAEQQEAEGDRAQHHLGRNSLHHTLWQRLERAAGGGGGSGGAGGSQGEPAESSPGSPGGDEERGTAAAEAADAALFVPETLPRKLRKRRALSPEERLVLGILSDPQFDYRGRTRLPPADLHAAP